MRKKNRKSVLGKCKKCKIAKKMANVVKHFKNRWLRWFKSK